jgi:hypothetical protein
MSSLGIGALKPRLSVVLREQIILEFPKLIRELKAGIDECRNQLTKLGDARTTVAEQRFYLMRISQLFSSVVRAALEGVYIYDFFGDAMTAAGYSRRLPCCNSKYSVRTCKGYALRGTRTRDYRGTR